MDFKNSYKQAGFTLMEVMVAVALISVLGMAIVSQTNLITSSKREADQNAIINGLSDRIIVELSRRSTCSAAANFGGKTMPPDTNTPTNIASVVNSEGAVIVASNTPYGQKVAGNSLSATNVNSVTTGQIQLKYKGNANEVVLSIPFNRKKGFGAIKWGSTSTIEVPLTVERNGALIASCYNDITNSITSAIRLSCEGNSQRFILRPDPVTYPAYAAFSAHGVCEHKVQTTACPTGQYIKRIEVDANKQVIYSCASVTNACPANQVITGFNPTDGSVLCDYPFVNCAAGEMMVMGSAGKYVCLKTTNPGGTGCTGLYAIQRFNADGSVTCAQYYPPRTCSGMVRSISPDGTTTCDAFVKAVVCPTGQYVSSVDGTGQPVCSKYYKYPQNCGSTSLGVYGLNSSGDVLCQPLTRRLTCGGAPSPTGRTQAECTAAGGALQSGFCRFTSIGASCPAGYTQCSSWRYTTTNSCVDGNSACSYSVQTRYAYGSNVFTNPVTPASTNCYYWARNSGPWVRSCTGYIQPATVAGTYQIGCY